jgi:hypothetical protein
MIFGMSGNLTVEGLETFKSNRVGLFVNHHPVAANFTPLQLYNSLKAFKLPQDGDQAQIRGQTMAVGNLIGYFTNRQEAKKALRELARQGFRRAVLIHKDRDGGIRRKDPFLWGRGLGVVLLAGLFGGGAGLAAR